MSATIRASLLGLLVLAGCASVDPAEEAAEKRAEREQLFDQADAAREDQRHGDERRVYDKLIRKDEEDARAHFRRGTTYMRESQLESVDDATKRRLYEKAIESFDRAIELRPNLYASAYFCRGECNRGLYLLGTGPVTEGKYLRRALRDYRMATQINRLHPQANKALGYLCQYVLPAEEAKLKAIHYYRMHLKAVGEDYAVQQWLERLIAQYGDPDNVPAVAPSENPGKPRPAKPAEGAGAKVPEQEDAVERALQLWRERQKARRDKAAGKGGEDRGKGRGQQPPQVEDESDIPPGPQGD